MKWCLVVVFVYLVVAIVHAQDPKENEGKKLKTGERGRDTESLGDASENNGKNADIEGNGNIKDFKPTKNEKGPNVGNAIDNKNKISKDPKHPEGGKPNNGNTKRDGDEECEEDENNANEGGNGNNNEDEGLEDDNENNDNKKHGGNDNDQECIEDEDDNEYEGNDNDDDDDEEEECLEDEPKKNNEEGGKIEDKLDEPYITNNRGKPRSPDFPRKNLIRGDDDFSDNLPQRRIAPRRIVKNPMVFKNRRPNYGDSRENFVGQIGDQNINRYRPIYQPRYPNMYGNNAVRNYNQYQTSYSNIDGVGNNYGFHRSNSFRPGEFYDNHYEEVYQSNDGPVIHHFGRSNSPFSGTPSFFGRPGRNIFDERPGGPMLDRFFGL